MAIRRKQLMWSARALLALTILSCSTHRWRVPASEGGPIKPLASSIRATPRVEVASTSPPGEFVAQLVSKRSSASGNPTHLRLAAYNIHSCRDADGNYHPALTAESITGFDLVSLHECRGSGPWWDADATELGNRLHMRSMFFPIETLAGHPWFGNGLLTKVPIASWETTCLPSGFLLAYRQMNHLVVPFGDGNLNVLFVHLGKRSEHAPQFQMVAQAFLQLPEPAVLMGDFNTRLDDPLVTDLLSHNVKDVVGERATCDPARVDFIFTRGVKCSDAGLIDNHASDHPLVWAEIEAR